MKLINGESIAVETHCKTWGCLGCRERMKTVVRTRMEVGISRLGQCWLITVTLRRGNGSPRDARFVARAWRLLLQRLRRRPSNRSLAWFRVVELTKKGTPHIHLIAGGLGGRIASCSGREHEWGRNWVDGPCKFDCLEHEWSKIWLEVTGDSWIVNVRPVAGERGASAYLSKYLVKAVQHREGLVALGFNRRWTCSRNWPVGELSYIGRADGYVLGTTWFPKHTERSAHLAGLAEESKGHPLLERVGDDMALHIAAVTDKRRLKGKVKGFDAYLR